MVKFVNLSYMIAFVLAFIVFNKATELLWSRVDSLPNIAIVGNQITLATVIALAMAAGLTLWAYNRLDYRSYLTEVVLEMAKVTWPSWEETKRATLVVIMFTLVASAFIFIADKFWQYVTDFLLIPGA